MTSRHLPAPVAAIALALLLPSCQSGQRMEAKGYAQGTTYSIIYFNDGTDLQYQIDSILVAFDRVLSTYQAGSFISRWNSSDTGISPQPAPFREVARRSVEVWRATDGAFDITVKPLMEFWFEQKWDAGRADTAALSEVMQTVGSQRIALGPDGSVWKDGPRIRLDVNAIAQGYSVDVVARYLQSRGVYDFLVEIGGEIRASGSKPGGIPWSVGIDRPEPSDAADRSLSTSLRLEGGKALATSGNYRKYVEVGGEKLGHSLDPLTGRPATTDVLSATVVASDAMTADAYATACVVMGLERSKRLLSSDSLQGLLIYSQGGELTVWVSDGLRGAMAE